MTIRRTRLAHHTFVVIAFLLGVAALYAGFRVFVFRNTWLRFAMEHDGFEQKHAQIIGEIYLPEVEKLWTATLILFVLLVLSLVIRR
jgi:hypothetical protein